MGLWERFQNFRQGTRPGARQAESPEQNFDRGIAEMADALQKAHAHFAELTTFERQLRAERDKAVSEANRLESDARRHVLTGRDDLARHALAEKSVHDHAAAEFGTQWDAHNAVMGVLQRQIEELLKQHRAAVQSRDLYVARKRAEDAQEQVRQTLHTAQAANPVAALRDAEARAVALAELAGHIPARSRRAEILDPDTQFDALREEIAPPTPAPNTRSSWFPDTAPAVPPAKPRDIWFADEPPAVQTLPPRDIWFSETPAPAMPDPPAHGLPDAATLIAGANRALNTDSDIYVSIGWQAAQDAPLAACAILVDAGGLAHDMSDIVSAPQKSSPDGSVVQNAVAVAHPADATVFTVSLSALPPGVEKIVFAVFVDEETATRPLRKIASAVYLRVLAASNSTALATVLLASPETDRALLLAEVYRHKGVWKVRALGQGFENGLEALLTIYGVLPA